MLSSTFFRAFTTPVTYALVLILVGTAVMQVRYVNKALQRFDSTQVIPIQFVIFTLSVIIGSAVLYRDFERTSAEQAVKFVGGCLFTFFGVFLITSGRSRGEDANEDGLSDEEGVEETIGLAEQEPAGPHTPQQHRSRRGSEAARSRRSSRRSSRASHVSFLESVNKPLTVLAETGVPSLRRVPGPVSAATGPSTTPGLGGDGAAVFPMFEADSPWREDVPSTPSLRPGMTPQALSSLSVPTINSTITTQELGITPPRNPDASSSTVPLYVESPPVTTPRAYRALSTSSRPPSPHFSPPMYSPSPLSSTVSAVVADSLLRGAESPAARRRLPMRRSRLGLRNSLFVPQDELDADDDDDNDDDDEEEDDDDDESFIEETSLSVGKHRPRTSNAAIGGAEDNEEGEQQLLGGGEGTRSVRTRARSFGHVIGDMFSSSRTKTTKKKKKRRRGARADADADETRTSLGRSAAAALGSERSVATASTK